MQRSRFSAVLLTLTLLLLAGTAFADGGKTPSVNMVVQSLSLASVTADRIQFTAHVSLASSRKVVMHEVVFRQLYANGIPFYASPIEDHVALLPGENVLPPKPLTLTVYLRDLASLKPLRQLVQDEKISITGTAYANLDLNPAEKLFLFTGHARVQVKVDSVVELHIPGGAFAKAAALLLIDRAQLGVAGAGSAWDVAARAFSKQRESLWNQFEPALVLARATYRLKGAGGKSFPFESTAMGFRVGRNQVVVPKCILVPWKFDPYVAASMEKDGALKVSDYELVLWPADARLRDDSGELRMDQAWRSSTHQIRILPLTRDDSSSVLLPLQNGKVVKVKVHRRQGAAALGLVEITGPALPPITAALAASGRTDEAAEQARSAAGPFAVFYFPEGIQARTAKPRMLLMPAEQGLSSLELDIDSSGWGSPVISRQGVVGVVTDEHSIVPITDAGTELNFDRREPIATPEGK
jgi:hypothetical protein